MKRTFWTRNLFIGVLVGLVMVFSIPGTGDAITRLTESSGDLQLHAPGEFTVRFSVGLQGPSIKPGHKRIPTRDTNGDPVTINQTTPYYDDSDGAGFLGDTPLSYADAHNYDQESINIAVTGATLTKVGNFGGVSAPHTMTEGGTDATRLTSSVTLTLTASTAGTVEIDITDTTASTDRASGATVATALDITVYIALTHDDTSTIALAAAPGAVGFSIAEEQINDDFSGLTDVRVNYTVSGSGSVYVRIGNRRLNGGKNLTTSNAAPVYLNMGGSTNKVTASVVGQRPDRAVSVTYIYSHATLTKESGDKQRGAASSRLANPLVVKVTDGKNRHVSGVEINFTAVGDGSFLRDPSFPSTLYVPETGTLTGIKTNTSGLANVFWVLGATGPQTATADLAVATDIQANSPIFTATFGTATSTPSSIAIESGDGQHADEFGLLKDPLVVVVRDQRGQRVTEATVRFIARDGGTLDLPSGDADEPGTQTSGGTSSDIIEDVDTNSSGEASVRYTPPDGGGRRTVSASLQDNPTKLVTFTVNGAPSTSTRTDDTTDDTSDREPTITRTLDIEVSGSGNTREVTVTALENRVSETGISVDLTVTGSGASLSRTSGGTPLESTLTLPQRAGTYTLRASTTASGYSAVTRDITITLPGSLSLTEIGGRAANGGQAIEVTVREENGSLATGDVSVTLSGVISRTVDTTNGTGRAQVVLPATGGTVILRADGYRENSYIFRAATTTTTTDTTTTTTTTDEEPAPEPDSIEISGPATRTGTANTALEASLLVRVLDDDDDPVEDVRVIFRVRTGQGRLSERGNGRAIAVQTDSRGYARAEYTPISASSTVEAEVRGVRKTVTFTISTGSAPPPRDTTPSTSKDTPPDTVSPIVLVSAAQRPPMLWVDGGKIYALVGAEVQEFIKFKVVPATSESMAEEVEVRNVRNIAIGGGKIYWTEQTGESSGTINAANLDGSDGHQLTAIRAVPIGIAVDVPNSKLYWTNSRGRIQSANPDGSGIQNVIQNLRNPNDLALAGGNVYWTESNHGSVRFVNLRGQKQVRVISTGDDPAGSLVIGGGKVYWTEKVGDSGGTINSANLNGSGAMELASIQAAPIGIGVDTARSKLFWTNARGRIQSAPLNGSSIQNVVTGLGSPGEIVLSNSLKAPATTPAKSTTTTAGKNKYDINGDGAVDDKDVDAIIVAVAAKITTAKYDVNGDGTVDFNDVVAVSANKENAAGAPTLLGRKFTALEVDRLQEQIDLLIASGDRSPAAMKTLIYLQQLIAMARPEKTQLLANYPNPFNPETWIPYELATDTDVKITIYTSTGVVVQALQLGHQSAGYYTDRDRAAYWDGRNAFGEPVASGVYYYQLETDHQSLLRKMVILK